MKRFLALLLTIVLILTLTACGSGKSDEPEASPAPEAGSKTEQKEQKPEENQKEYLVETEFLTPDSVASVKCSGLAMEDCTEVSAVDYDWYFYATYGSPEDAGKAYQEYAEYINSNFSDLKDSKGNTITLPDHDDTLKWFEISITFGK